MGSSFLSDSSQVVIKKAYVDTDHGQLHYRYFTPASPVLEVAKPPQLPILLLHMSASSSKCFTSMMKPLSALGYTCYAPDMPGFGSSDDPESDSPSISWYAGLYHTIFSQMAGFEQGCHVVGHHSGGVTGIELAQAAFGNFCRTLTIVGPAIMSAEERREMSKTFLDPFNRPVASGEHLTKTWEYLRWEGIPEENVDLMHREVLDHVRAWKGRSQIYACVWAYDCAEAMRKIRSNCKIMGLCARDDVLWPYFQKFKDVRTDVKSAEIQGGNFGPDLDTTGILDLVIPFITEKWILLHHGLYRSLLS